MALMDNISQTAKTDEFVRVYKDMIDAMRDDKRDNVRYKRLEARSDTLWTRLKDIEKGIALKDLCKSDHVPALWVEIHESGCKLVKIT